MQNGNALSFETEMEQSIVNLLTFLEDKELRRGMDHLQIIVHGVHPPPLDTEQMTLKLKQHFRHKSTLTDQFVEQHLKVKSHRERTEMARRYNEILERECRRRHIQFVQVLEDIVNDTTGTVDERFRKSDTDVHLKNEELIPIYHRKFKEIKLKFAMDIDAVWNKARSFKRHLEHRLDG